MAPTAGSGRCRRSSGAAVTLGCRGSRTFQKIVGQIDRSSGIVYVNWARLGGLPAGVEAALQAILLVGLTVPGICKFECDGDRLANTYRQSLPTNCSTCLRSSRDPALVNAAAVEERFARDAWLRAARFETAAAVRIGRTVYDELRKTGALRLPTPPEADGHAEPGDRQAAEPEEDQDQRFRRRRSRLRNNLPRPVGRLPHLDDRRFRRPAHLEESGERTTQYQTFPTLLRGSPANAGFSTGKPSLLTKRRPFQRFTPNHNRSQSVQARVALETGQAGLGSSGWVVRLPAQPLAFTGSVKEKWG